MSDGKGPEKPAARKFTLARRVKEKPPEPPRPYSEQVLNEVEQDTAEKGTPEMQRAVNHGCSGCLKVTLLFFLIMAASILATCVIRRTGV